MRDNGTDRDVALQMLSKLNAIGTAIAQINDKMYVPHIVTQPVDMEVAVGGTCTFTVVADNVVSYQWQYNIGQGVWSNMEPPIDGTKSTLSFVKASSSYTNTYRCKLTGKDGSVIYTDVVKPINPDS